MALAAPLREPLHMEPVAIEVVRRFLLHFADELKGEYENHPDVLSDQLRDLLADAVQRAHKDGADFSPV